MTRDDLATLAAGHMVAWFKQLPHLFGWGEYTSLRSCLGRIAALLER